MGKTLNAKDLQRIEMRIGKAKQILASSDPEYAKLTPGEQMAAAAKQAAEDIVFEKKRAAINVARQIVAHDINHRFMEAQAPKENRFAALRRIAVVDQDRGANVRAQEQVRQGIVKDSLRQLQQVADVTSKYFGFLTNRAAVRDMIREGMGEDSHNPTAKAAWKAWADVAENLRQQFNEAGGAIRKLSYGYVPQRWDWYKASKVSTEEFIGDFLPRLRRDAYFNENGSPMTDGQLRDFLAKAHDSIRTDGASDLEPGEQGESALKNRRQERRVIHLKDGDAWMDMQAKYGQGSMLEAMIGHVNGMARDIAAMKTWGPNADAGFKTMLDMAEKAESKRMAPDKIAAERYKTQVSYDIASGKLGPMANPTIARMAQNVRALMMFKLGSSAISALSDGANVRAIARANNIPQIKAWLHQMKAWTSSDYRQFVRSQGAGIEATVGHINRFAEEVTHAGMPMQIATSLLRVFGLNFVDGVRRTGMGGVMMEHLGSLVAKHETVPEGTVIASRGITNDTWQIWRQAKLERGMLTPDSVGRVEGLTPSMRRQAMQDLTGAMASDVDTVVPMPTDRTRAKVQAALGAANFARGTVGGELMRSLLQFKGFPLAMFGNAMRRMAGIPTLKGKAFYAAEFIATASILGAVSVQLKELANGKNPQDMTDPKFAGRAFVQGGALGLYGDTLKAVVDPYGFALGDQLGPTVSTIEDFEKLFTKGNRGATGTQLLRGMTPEPFYAKAAIDHLIFQRMQDYFSPGYGMRAQQRAQADFHNGFYWQPSTSRNIPAPQAPNFRTAIGKR